MDVSGVEVTLAQVLNNKELRLKRQQEWLNRHSSPLVSFSINMPGPVKQNAAAIHIFNKGVQEIVRMCIENNWTIIDETLINQITGPEAIFAISCDAIKLKRALVDIEQMHKLGRLMDLDVIDLDGKSLSRQTYSLPKRRCFICDEDAVICARSRRHDLPLLLQKIKEITNER